ncbi:MAG: hypothetical protein ABH840_00310, partial [Nanoarchaeota archaeon]
MKIQIPEQFMGRKIEGAIERVLSKKSEGKQEPETPEQDDSNVQDLSGYIYVPSIKLHVAKERTLPNLTWAKTQEELKR